MHDINILNTQQEILRLLIQSEATLKDLQTSNDKIHTSISTKNHHAISRQTIQTKIINTNKNQQPSILKYNALAKERNLLESERQKVANMEMVIAVVGAMKSGKSTIINALVGQEILPNCELPMTTLPTLITHKQGQTIPILKFHHKQPLLKLREQVIKKLETTKIGVHQPFMHSPTGQRLLNQLQTNKTLPLATHYEGQAAIFTVLQQLNDLMRMAQILEINIPYRDYQHLHQLPRIDVEFFHLRHNQHFQQTRLSFLDTPGLNEQGNNSHIHTIFQQQLEQSSAILLAIDYTQMNSVADKLIRHHVEKIQTQLRQKLIVFVNKFDNAHANTMDAERTKNYIAQQLIGHATLPKKYIFPISSWWGYLANKALIALEQNNQLDPKESWVQDFGEAALGRCWHKKIANPDEVKEASQALWQDSKFSAPINDVITTIHTQSAFKCLDSSLDKLETRLSTLNKAISHHLTHLKKSITPSQEKMDQLNQEITRLSEMKQQVEHKKSLIIHETNKRIANKKNKHIHRSLKITNIFIETGYKENQLIAEINQKGKTKNIYAEIRKSENNNLCYKNRDNAIYLLNDMQCYINSIKRNLLEKSNILLKENIEEMKEKISFIFDDEFKTAFNRTIKNKEVIFYGSFILPEFICKKHIESLQIKNLISVGIEEKTSTRQRDYVKNKVLNSVNDTWGKKTHTKEIKKFEVNIQKIKKYIQNDMNEYTTSIKNHHKKYLDENIIQKIKKDTEEVKYHLKNKQIKLKGSLKLLIKETKKNKQTIKALEKANKNITSILKDTKNQRGSVKKSQQKKVLTPVTEKILVAS